MVTYELSFSDQIMATFDTGLPLYTFRLKEEINVKNTVRISLNFYNTYEEIDYLISVLKNRKEIFNF